MKTYTALIVEDDEAFIHLIRLALRDLHFDVSVVKNGQAALDALQSRCFDLVISDYRLPEHHGLEVIQAAQTHNASCRILLISAARQDLIAPNFETLKLIGFLQKPVGPSQIRKVVSDTFGV